MIPNARPFVVVTRALPRRWLERLEADCEVLAGPPDHPGLSPSVIEALPRAQGLLCLLTETIDAATLDQAPRLRVVSNVAVGVDNIDVAACTERSIPVGHTPGVLTEATADLTMALLLSAARRLPQAAADVRAGRWDTWSPTGWLGADLYGATIGIVGMGNIGRAVAKRCAGFGLRVVYVNRSPVSDPPPGSSAVSLHTLLEISDFVSLHVPLNTGTLALIDDEALGRMKPTAILINTARGPIVDTTALQRALQANAIAAAAIDVTDPEPLPADHPLLGCPNLLVLPHIGSATHGTRRRMTQLAVDNLLAGLQGRPLPHCVNPEFANHSTDE